MQNIQPNSKRVAANQVRPAEQIAEGALRLFDTEGRSIDVYILNAERTGMLYLLFEGKPFVAMPKEPPVLSFTPEGIQDGRVNLSAAQLLMDAKDCITYVQDVALDGTLRFCVVMRYLRPTDGQERFFEVQIEGFALPQF